MSVPIIAPPVSPALPQLSAKKRLSFRSIPDRMSGDPYLFPFWAEESFTMSKQLSYLRFVTWSLVITAISVVIYLGEKRVEGQTQAAQSETVNARTATL